MSLYRQSGGGDRSASRSHTDHHPPIEGQVHHRPPRLRRAGKPHHRLPGPPPATLFVVALTLVALLTFLGSRRLFRRNEKGFGEEDDGGRREMGLVMTLGQNVGKDQIGDNGDSARGISGNVQGLSNGAEMDPDDEYDDDGVDGDDDGDDDGVGVDHDDGDDVDKVGEDAFVSALERDSANGEEGDTEKNGDRASGDNVKRSGSRRKSRSKRKPKRHKFLGDSLNSSLISTSFAYSCRVD